MWCLGKSTVCLYIVTLEVLDGWNDIRKTIFCSNQWKIQMLLCGLCYFNQPQILVCETLMQPDNSNPVQSTSHNNSLRLIIVFLLSSTSSWSQKRSKSKKVSNFSKYKFSLGDLLFEISMEHSLDFKLDFGMSSCSLKQLSSFQGQSFETKNKTISTAEIGSLGHLF